MTKAKAKQQDADVVPLYGRDEMNLVEFPIGPITASAVKTLEVEHPVFDRSKKREVIRRLIITGSDAFGLPRPIDDQVLVGMKALTHEAGSSSRRVQFSRYHLCRTIGWNPDGRAYRRLEESFDRIAGTTLKFRDAWWDKGEREWKSKTFHLIDEVDLCSRDQMERTRVAVGKAELKLCHFVWNEVIWKSLEDGFIKSLDMDMFRRIARGRRREVPLRLFRILDKRLHGKDVARFDLRKLCIGILGLNPTYCPSEMARVLDRAVRWLVECGYLIGVHYDDSRGPGTTILFERQPKRPAARARQRTVAASRERVGSVTAVSRARSKYREWLCRQPEPELVRFETEALTKKSGTEFERRMVQAERNKGIAIMDSGRLRHDYLRKYIEQNGQISARMSRRGFTSETT